MKKFLALTLALVMSLSLVACGDKKTDDTKTDAPDQTEQPAENEGAYKVAMITDYGDITDQSFNQTTYEACKAFAEDNSIEFSYFRPAGDNTADRVAMIEKAVDEGFNVIVMPGYAFGGAIVEAAPEFPDVKFIALDVAAGDLLETAVAKAGESYDFNPSNWDLNKYVDMSNVYCAVYQEELCGYMAGYAAVKLGYKNLGFLGGMSVPAVVRYGYGFVQGVDAAAADLGLTDVTVNYVYGGQFFGDADITAVMDTWYAGEDGLTVTSAMKGLYPTTYDTLTDVVLNGNWDNYKGTIATLGLVSGDDPTANYVQIPMETTQWEDGKFTQDDYKAMVKDMFDGKITVSNDTGKAPADFATVISVDDQGAIKG